MRDFFTVVGITIYTLVLIVVSFGVGFLSGIQFYDMCIR